jgi:hypothetical protein
MAYHGCHEDAVVQLITQRLTMQEKHRTEKNERFFKPYRGDVISATNSEGSRGAGTEGLLWSSRPRMERKASTLSRAEPRKAWASTLASMRSSSRVLGAGASVRGVCKRDATFMGSLQMRGVTRYSPPLVWRPGSSRVNSP